MLFSTILLFASQILSFPVIEREHQFLSNKKQSPAPAHGQSQQEELVDNVAAALQARREASALGIQMEKSSSGGSGDGSPIFSRPQRSDTRIPGTLITTTEEQAADPRIVSFWQDMAKNNDEKEQAQAGDAVLGLDVGRGIETTGVAAKASSILSRLRFW